MTAAYELLKSDPTAQKCRLTRITSSNNAMRTPSLEGYTTMPWPVPGERFVMFGEPLNPDADVRLIATSEVRAVLADGRGYSFSTRNSTYRLDYIE